MDFFKDLFEGDVGPLTLLTAHTPDLGAWTRPEIDLDDGGSWSNTSNPAATTQFVYSGGLYYDQSISSDVVPILKAVQAPGLNVFAEFVFNCEPSTTSVDILVAMRAAASGAWTNAINFIGGGFRVNSTATVRVRRFQGSSGFGEATAYTSAAAYGSGRFTFTIRIELMEGVRTLYLDGVAVFADDISGTPEFLIPDGDIYLAVKYTAAPLTGNLYDAPILSFRTGTLPEEELGGVFWQPLTNNLTEVDAA